MKLSTIQKHEKLNDVYAVDDVGPGGAYHNYFILKAGVEPTHVFSGTAIEVPQDAEMAHIWFQKGPRKEPASQHGVIDSDLLEIVRHRLQCFQRGEFAMEYNAKALEHIQLALMYMNRRVEDRIERQVLGTYEK